MNLILPCHTIPHAVPGLYQRTLGEGTGFTYDCHIDGLSSPTHKHGAVTNGLLPLWKTTQPNDLERCFLRSEVGKKRLPGPLRLPCGTCLVLLPSLRGVTLGSTRFRITSR